MHSYSQPSALECIDAGCVLHHMREILAVYHAMSLSTQRWANWGAGGDVGLMGQLARSVREADGKVVGFMPENLVQQEVLGPMAGDTRIVADTHERKADMAKESDAFIALPGG